MEQTPRQGATPPTAPYYGTKATDASGAAVFPGLPLSATRRLTISARTPRCGTRTVEHLLQEVRNTVRVELVC